MNTGNCGLNVEKEFKISRFIPTYPATLPNYHHHHHHQQQQHTHTDTQTHGQTHVRRPHAWSGHVFMRWSRISQDCLSGQQEIVATPLLPDINSREEGEVQRSVSGRKAWVRGGKRWTKGRQLTFSLTAQRTFGWKKLRTSQQRPFFFLPSPPTLLPLTSRDIK